MHASLLHPANTVTDSSIQHRASLCLSLTVSSHCLTLSLSLSAASLEFLDNMEKLDLSYNKLVSVGPGVFRGLSRLRQLYLHNNKLTMVQHGSLDMLPGLEVNRLFFKWVNKLVPQSLFFLIVDCCSFSL